MNSSLIISIGSAVLLLGIAHILIIQQKKITLKKGPVNTLSDHIADGLNHFSTRVLSSTLQTILYMSIILFIFSTLLKKPFSWIQILAFAIGGILMSLSAYIGIKTPAKLLTRIIQNSEDFVSNALHILIKGSAKIAFLMVSIISLGLIGCYLFLGIQSIIGFGLGVVIAAFILRIGSGLFKSATDISADIAPKLEKRLPHFDCRNPATILDIVGDIVGKMIGYVSDIFSSFIFSLISGILIPYLLYQSGKLPLPLAKQLWSLPFYILGIGLLVSVICFCFYLLRSKSASTHNLPLEGVYVGVSLSGILIVALISIIKINGTNTINSTSILITYFIGLLGGFFIAIISEFLTSNRFPAAKKIASEAEYGPSISLFHGLSLGLKSNAFFLIFLVCISLPCFYFSGFLGISMATLGMLSTTSLILIISTFTPLAASAYKISRLVNCSETIQKNTKKLDTIGNTTIALGNGFAAGAAILSTFSLFLTLLLITHSPQTMTIDIFLIFGLMIGIAIPFIFSGYLVSGLIKNIHVVLTEISRQFKEIPFLTENKAHPDIKRATDDQARSAMDALIIPGVLMALPPIIIGYLLGTKVLIGFVLGVFLSGFSQTFYWGNMGDSLHNAKHYIQSGHFGGTESPTFQNILIADNVGDAFKDLLGPSINILIKSVTIITTLLIILLST